LRHITENDFDEAWKIFDENKEWFPHVRKSHVRVRIFRKQIIIHDNVLITYHQNKNNRKIGRLTDVSVTAGSHVIHQIINATKGKGNAEKVIKEFFDFVGTDVYLTVRSENIPANRFYEKVGMEKVGYINWSEGKMPGNVWKKSLTNT